VLATRTLRASREGDVRGRVSSVPPYRIRQRSLRVPSQLGCDSQTDRLSYGMQRLTPSDPRFGDDRLTTVPPVLPDHAFAFRGREWPRDPKVGTNLYIRRAMLRILNTRFAP
jgi:hypothetical protein